MGRNLGGPLMGSTLEHEAFAPAPRVAAVLFDVGGTLDADGVPWSAQFHAAYRAHGGALPLPTFAERFRASDTRLAQHPAIATLGLRDTLHAQSALLAEGLPDAGALDLGAIAEAVYDAARATAARNRAVLAALRPHVRLGVVSNFTGNVARCLADLGLLAAFDVVLDSAVVGVAKPDAAIFRRALDALGVRPNAALMVGDNPVADVLGARRAGLQACWLAPDTRRTPTALRGVPRIARLADVLDRPGVAPVGEREGAACTG